MPRLTAPIALLLCVLVAACGQSDSMSSDSDLDPQVAALVGASGAAGESQLQTLGYAAVGGSQEAGASVTYWRRASDSTCIEVRTVNGSYEAIEPAEAAECVAAEAATRAVATADPGGYRTVCGVMVDGAPVRYVCSVVAGDQHTEPTTLTFPDMEMTLRWQDAERVSVEMEGMVPIEATWAEAEGEVSTISPEQTWFYIANREMAAAEVAAMGG